MTPDERADRAERVIRESYKAFLNAAAFLREEFQAPSSSASRCLELCARELACHAAIAGIPIEESTK